MTAWVLALSSTACGGDTTNDAEPLSRAEQAPSTQDGSSLESEQTQKAIDSICVARCQRDCRATYPDRTSEAFHRCIGECSRLGSQCNPIEPDDDDDDDDDDGAGLDQVCVSQCEKECRATFPDRTSEAFSRCMGECRPPGGKCKK